MFNQAIIRIKDQQYVCNISVNEVMGCEAPEPYKTLLEEYVRLEWSLQALQANVYHAKLAVARNDAPDEIFGSETPQQALDALSAAVGRMADIRVEFYMNKVELSFS